MKKIRIGFAFAFMCMIFNGIFFTLYDKIVEGYVNTKFLALTSLLGFFSGFVAYFSLLITGANEWI